MSNLKSSIFITIRGEKGSTFFPLLEVIEMGGKAGELRMLDWSIIDEGNLVYSLPRWAEFSDCEGKVGIALGYGELSPHIVKSR